MYGSVHIETAPGPQLKLQAAGPNSAADQPASLAPRTDSQQARDVPQAARPSNVTMRENERAQKVESKQQHVHSHVHKQQQGHSNAQKQHDVHSNVQKHQQGHSHIQREQRKPVTEVGVAKRPSESAAAPAQHARPVLSESNAERPVPGESAASYCKRCVLLLLFVSLTALNADTMYTAQLGVLPCG